MTLQQLKYVVTVADKKSINEAAKSLYISQPSLSAAIRDLESELNISIFIRSNRGVVVTPEGEEFLSHARQIVQHSIMLEKQYMTAGDDQERFSVSTQHYTFVATAFVNFVKKYSGAGRKFALHEAKTYDIITDVRMLRSELGIIFLNLHNQSFLSRFLKECNLQFFPLFETKPHVFISQENPLSKKSVLSLSDLSGCPAIVFEQGDYNSSFFSEEVVNNNKLENTITVSDRASVFDLILAANSYIITTGVYVSNSVMNGIVSIPLDVEEQIRIGVIRRGGLKLTEMAEAFLHELDSILILAGKK